MHSYKMKLNCFKLIYMDVIKKVTTYNDMVDVLVNCSELDAKLNNVDKSLLKHY